MTAAVLYRCPCTVLERRRVFGYQMNNQDHDRIRCDPVNMVRSDSAGESKVGNPKKKNKKRFFGITPTCTYAMHSLLHAFACRIVIACGILFPIHLSIRPSIGSSTVDGPIVRERAKRDELDESAADGIYPFPLFLPPGISYICNAPAE